MKRSAFVLVVTVIILCFFTSCSSISKIKNLVAQTSNEVDTEESGDTNSENESDTEDESTSPWDGVYVNDEMTIVIIDGGSCTCFIEEIGTSFANYSDDEIGDSVIYSDKEDRSVEVHCQTTITRYDDYITLKMAYDLPNDVDINGNETHELITMYDLTCTKTSEDPYELYKKCKDE